MSFGEAAAGTYLQAQQQQIERALRLADHHMREQQMGMQREELDFRKQAHADDQELRKSALAASKADKDADNTRQLQRDRAGAIKTLLDDYHSNLLYMEPGQALASLQIPFSMLKRAQPDLFEENDLHSFIRNQILNPKPPAGAPAPSGGLAGPMPWADTGMPQAPPEMADAGPMAGSFAGAPGGPGGFAPPQQAAPPFPFMHGAQPMASMPQGDPSVFGGGSVPPELAAIAPGLLNAGIPTDGAGAPAPAGTDWGALAAQMGMGTGVGPKGRQIDAQVNNYASLADRRIAQTLEGVERIRQRDEALGIQREMMDLRKPGIKLQAKLLSEKIAAFQGDQQLKDDLKRATISHLRNMDQLAAYRAVQADNRAAREDERFKQKIAGDELGGFQKMSSMVLDYERRIAANDNLIRQSHANVTKLMRLQSTGQETATTEMEIRQSMAHAEELAAENVKLKAEVEPIRGIASVMLENLKSGGFVTDATGGKVPKGPAPTPQRQPSFVPNPLRGGVQALPPGALPGMPATAPGVMGGGPSAKGLSPAARKLAEKFKISVP